MLEPNTILQERYQVAHQIGQGGMGAVYEAVDLRLGNTVALKQTLLPGTHTGKAFEREARLLAGLRHPSLPKVIDHFADANGQYLVMEYIAGDDLATLLDRRGLPFGISEVLGWALQLLRVLEYLHSREPPILHRDIKPQNLKLTGEGVLVLLDFGLAKGDPSLQPPLSVTGSVFGYTPHYAPLEQIHNSGTDARSDLYALAATLHHLLTGARPIDALTRATNVLRRQPDPMRSPTELNPRVPPEVSQVLMQALSLNQDDRPIDAAAMRAALEQASEGAGLSLADKGRRTTGRVTPATAGDNRHTAQTNGRLTQVWQRLAATPVPQVLRGDPARRWGIPLAGVFVLILLVFATVSGRPAPAPTPQPATNTTTAGTAAASPAPVSGATAAPSATTIPPTPPSTSPAATPIDPARADALDPPEAYAGSLPITITVRGARLDSVRQFSFSTPGGATIDPQVQRSDANTVLLVIDALPPLQRGEQAFTLFLDGVAQSRAVVLRDYLALKEMKGVRAAYAYTGRVQNDATGAFTQMLSEPTPQGAPVVVLRATDQVDILRDDVAGWYRVRLWIDGQTPRTSVTGWIERWLVDDEAVPQPKTLEFRGSLVGTPTDAAVQCGTQFRSSVWGSVNRTNDEGIAGALVRVTSISGRDQFTQRTDAGGSFKIPGLGCTEWIVELVEVPGTTFRANPVRARLNGGLYTAAEIRFRQLP
jgi:eukaryotic-like serine/threonine-protein kinase